MKRRIMAVGAHADDVEICFSGTLFKYLGKGYDIVYVQATNNMSGNTRRVGPDGKVTTTFYGTVETMAYRKAECDRAAALFGTTPIHLDHPQRHYNLNGKQSEELRYGCALPAGVVPNVPSILTAYEDAASVKRVTDLILENDPEAVFSHGLIEHNPEHSTTALLVLKAYWKAVEAGYQGGLFHAINARFKELGMFYQQWETWVDISGYEDRKIAAIQTHASQFPPDFEDGARYYREVISNYGASCGMPAAEIFNCVNPSISARPESDLLSELLQHRGAWRMKAT